jgi:hypothetical protein
MVLAVLGLTMVSIPAGLAESQQYQCRRGDLVRRIEVQFANDADRLPCKVLYWRETEASAPPRVPWTADHQLEFCTGKAREMVDSLEGAGWACAGDAPLPEDAAERDQAAERSAAEPSAAQTTPPAARAATANASSKPDQAAFEAALARDLRRLDELAGGSSGGFESTMAVLGDLDGDGVDDGAALLSHEDADGGSSHHLLAYRFDGRTFVPVARVNLEAYYQNFTEVAIQGIAKQGIEVLLHTKRGGDPACCPSGRRHATFELRDGRLVLAAESDSGA